MTIRAYTQSTVDSRSRSLESTSIQAWPTLHEGIPQAHADIPARGGLGRPQLALRNVCTSKDLQSSMWDLTDVPLPLLAVTISSYPPPSQTTHAFEKCTPYATSDIHVLLRLPANIPRAMDGMRTLVDKFPNGYEIAEQ